MGKISEFFRGLLVGLCAGLCITGITLVMVKSHYREKELLEHVEESVEFQALWEDYRHRPVDEFLSDPAVRGAVDGAGADFDRRRDELLQRFRGGIID